MEDFSKHKNDKKVHSKCTRFFMERKNQNEENENGDIISCQCIVDGRYDPARGTTNTGMNAADQGE